MVVEAGAAGAAGAQAQRVMIYRRGPLPFDYVQGILTIVEGCTPSWQ